MLSTYTPTPALAVSDLDRARAFYEGTLGFSPDTNVPEGVLYHSGASSFLVYPSAHAGSNKATSMALQVPVDAFDAEIAELRSRGLRFDTFDLPGATWTDGVATGDGMRAVWFHDPDGNFIAVEAMG